MTTRIAHICEKEDVVLTPEAMCTLSQASQVSVMKLSQLGQLYYYISTTTQVSGGDLRRAITTLQSAVRLVGNQVDRCVLRVMSYFITCACPASTALRS